MVLFSLIKYCYQGFFICAKQLEEGWRGGGSIYNEDIKYDEEEGGGVYEEIFDEEEVGNYDEMTDYVVIWVGSEEERGVEE